MSAPNSKMLHNQSILMKAVEIDLGHWQSYALNLNNNNSVSIQFLKPLGIFTTIRVKLASIHFEDGQRRPCFLRVLSKKAIFECPIESNGWYSIDGLFEISQNEIITFTCISTWGPQTAGLQEAKIEALEFIHRDENWGQDLSTSSITEEFALLASQSVDPLGITLRKEDHFVKLIREHASHSWKTFVHSIAFKESVIAGMILPSTTVETGNAYFTHATITDPVWGSNFLLTFSQLKSFAKQILLLMEELIGYEDGAYCLIDAHAGNFAQTGAGKFSLLDYGSIASFDPNVALGGLENFTRMILLPLAICARENTLSFEEAIEGIDIDGQVINTGSSWQIIADTFKIPYSQCNSIPDFIDLFDRLRQWVDSLTRPANVDFWSNYHPDNFHVEGISQSLRWLIDPNHDVCNISERDRTVVEFLSAMNHESLIDLGCNTGKFSVYAALLGYQVSAIDSSEQGIDALFKLATSEGLPISSYHGSVFDKGVFGSCDADVVLALALTHHLLLGDYSPERQEPNSMDAVCSHISGLAKKAALIEFMPLGVGSAANDFLPLPNPLPNWYNINNFELTLSKYFSLVTKVEYNGEVSRTRVLFVCEK
jgi:SAM-dependent methyltransferase